MSSSWLKVVDAVLRPARPHLERCLAERENHLASRRLAAEERARAIKDCEGRIESCRAAVLAANDGIVPAVMTDLEHEWRTLSRPDPDAGLMDLWARIAPASWIDRKRWRDTDAGVRLEAAIALAADVDGVEAAEAAIGSLRAALAAWGTPVGSRVRWRLLAQDSEHTSALYAEPLRAAREAAASRPDAGAVVLERAARLRHHVHQAALIRVPERPLLARDLAHAAFVDCVWRATSLAALPNPVSPLCEIWRTGYVLATIDASGVTLEIPGLDRARPPAAASC
jgi:hypothetical protein